MPKAPAELLPQATAVRALEIVVAMLLVEVLPLMAVLFRVPMLAPRRLIQPPQNVLNLEESIVNVWARFLLVYVGRFLAMLFIFTVIVLVPSALLIAVPVARLESAVTWFLLSRLLA